MLFVPGILDGEIMVIIQREVKAMEESETGDEEDNIRRENISHINGIQHEMGLNTTRVMMT